MTSFGFAQPYWLALLLLLLPMVYYHWKRQPLIRFSHVLRLRLPRRQSLGWISHGSFILRSLAFILLVVALARPQTGRHQSKQKTEGLDIMLVMDTSGSMQAMDFVVAGQRHDRLQVVKAVVQEFIQQRTDDRLGMVVFGTNAFAQSPLTLDHDVLQQYLDRLEIGMAGEATAIGDALGVATNRLKELETKSKVIILLTDGSNTAGKIDPRQSCKSCKSHGSQGLHHWDWF